MRVQNRHTQRRSRTVRSTSRLAGARRGHRSEAVKKSPEEQKHFTQRRKGLEGAKKTEQLLFASLCALASLREIVYFFTASL
jgi:hypothetical protein